MINIAEQQRLETSLNELIERCRSITSADVSSRAMTTARHSLLDWFGCAIAGANEPAAKRFRAILEPTRGASPMIGTADALHWRDALVVNGFNGHLLDFDDMLPSFSGHPSAVIVPALLVVGEQTGASVEKLLCSLIVGTEVGNWVAAQVMPGHYDAGWHATGTIGTFAAAAAVCHLREMGHEQWITALDAAATQAAGLKAMFGTLAKPMHAGNAAQAGVMAANLATITTSTGRALIGPNGFIANYSGAGIEYSEQAYEFAIEGMLYKTYASCFMTQAAVDAGIKLRGQDLDNAKITLRVSPKLRDVCAIENPTTSNDAKFSLHATFALAALGHDLSSEEAFDPAHLVDPTYQKLRSNISLEFAPELAGFEPRIEIEVISAAGSFSDVVDRGEPAKDLDARSRQLQSKFNQLAVPYMGSAQVEALEHIILHSRSSSVGELIATASYDSLTEITI